MLELVLELMVLLFEEVFLLMEVFLDLTSILHIGSVGLHALLDNKSGVVELELLPPWGSAVNLLDVVESAVEGCLVEVINFLTILDPLSNLTLELLGICILKRLLLLLELCNVLADILKVLDPLLNFVFNLVG